MTFIAEFEQALTNYYQAEAKADAEVKRLRSFMSVEDLQIALENERICAERLGKVVAKHLKQLNNAGRCCE